MTVQDTFQSLKSGPYRLRLDDFLLLDCSGAFDDHAKTELLEGEIFYMNAQHRPHARVKMKLYEALTRALRDIDSTLSVMVETSVAISEHDAPEPDLTLTNEPDGPGLIPAPSVALIVEVSDTTLNEDLGRKQRIYAAGGIPEYWVADVNARVIHQMWTPAGDAYAERQEVAFGDWIGAATIEGLTVTAENS